MAQEKLPNFLKRDGKSLLFNLDEGEFVFFVPEVFFDSDKIAIIKGTQVSLMGILNYAIFDKNGKSKGLKPFTFPTIFECEPYAIQKVKGFNVMKYMKEATEDEDIDEEDIPNNPVDPDEDISDEDVADYRLLRFKKGDKIVVSTAVPKSNNNIEYFFNLFLLTAKIPTTIPYDKLHEYFLENADLNGFNYNLNIQMFGITVSEVARCKNDISKPFRLSNSTDMHSYKPVSIKLTPKFVSPYVSIGSENFDQSLMGAILTDNKHDSPLEKVLMM